MPTRREYLSMIGIGAAAVFAGCTGNKNAGNSPADGGQGNAASTSGGSGGSTVEIMIAWSGGDGAAAFDSLHKGFGQQYPDVKTTVNDNPGGAGTGLATALDTRMFNKNPPSTWGFFPGPTLKPYANAGLLGDISKKVWKQDGLEDVVPQYLQDLCKFDKIGYVGVPIEYNRLNNLFYNESVVQKAGVDPTSIESPTDLLDAMDQVESKTDAVGMAQSTKAAWTVEQLWETMYVGENGYDSYKSFLKGNVSDHESEIKGTLQTLKKYKSHFNGDAASVNFSEAISKFIAGDAAFLNQGAWAVGNFNKADGFEYDSDWNSVSFPGTKGIFMGQNSSFMYPTPNPSPSGTIKWLRYCGTKEAQKRFNSIKGGIPCRNDIDISASGKWSFNAYQQGQYKDFLNADKLTGTIAHNNVVVPKIKSNFDGVFSTYAGSWNVDKTYQGIVDAFNSK